MNASNRVIAGLIATVACVAAVAMATPRWDRPRPRVPGLRSSLLSGPTEQGLIVQRRVDARNQVVDRLLADELTLTEAAAWFRYFNDNPPEHRCDYRGHWPGDSDGEKLCRQVIAWTRSTLSVRVVESEREMIVRRFEDELNALLSSSDVVELPW